MEEIEYLEEYEDFILPKKTNCTRRLSADERSLDSLDVLYLNLIGESTCNVTETATSISQPEQTTSLNTVSVGLYTTPIQVSKCNAITGSNVSMNSTNTSALQQSIYNCQSSFINRSTNKSFNSTSSLQRTDKLKSVATVKPTLQRITNPTKKCIQNSSPPLKKSKMETSSYSYSRVPPISTSTEPKIPFASKAATNVTKSSLQSKSVGAAISNPNQGSGVDPLSLDNLDAFLDFDDDPNDGIDTFFESDLDNSITCELSDMDSVSVDLSDDYSDNNFDLQSELSSESFNIKKTAPFKKNRQLESTAERMGRLKNSTRAASTKPEPKIESHCSGIRSMVRNKKPQFKAGPDKEYTVHNVLEIDKRPNQSFQKRKICKIYSKSQTIARKRTSSTHLATQSRKILGNPKMPKLKPQICSPVKDKLSSVVPISGKNPIMSQCRKLAMAKSPCPTTRAPQIVSSEKQDTAKSLGNVKKIRTSDEISRSISKEPLSDEVINRIICESPTTTSAQSIPSADRLSNKDLVVPDKSVRTKLGSLYLRSIKPPVCKDLLEKKMSLKTIPTKQNLLEQNKSTVTPQIIKKLPESEEPKDKDVPQMVPLPLCKEPKTIFSVSKFSYSNKLHKQSLLQKSPSACEDDKSLRKSKENEESDTIRLSIPPESDKIKRQLLKPPDSDTNDKIKSKSPNDCTNGGGSENQSSTESVPENGSPKNTNIVEKSFSKNKSDPPNDKQIVYSTDCSLSKQLESNAKENDSLTESLSITTAIQKKVDNKKMSKLQYSFKTRRFVVRLNKRTVTQFIQSSETCLKRKASKIPELVMLAPPIIDPSPVAENTLSEIDQNKMNISQNDANSAIQETPKRSEVSADLKKNLEQKNLKETPTVKNGSRKALKKRKKKKTKTSTPIKVLRSSSKLSKSSALKNDELSSCQPSSSVVDESSYSASPVSSNQENTTVTRSIRICLRAGRAKKSAIIPSLTSDVSAAPVIFSTAESSGLKRKRGDQSLNQNEAAVVDERIGIEKLVPESLQLSDSTTNDEIGDVQLKKELTGETIIFQCQPESMSSPTRNCGKKMLFDDYHKTNSSLKLCQDNQRSNQLLPNTCTTNSVKSCCNSQITVFELPSYIVMKTKIVTRNDLQSTKAFIPPLVKHKIDKLAEERQAIPVFKTERPEFKDVCLEINALLSKNANYLKFASSSERLTRMNHVLADSSLSMEDAQCALKFLQSYLSHRTKDTTVKSKGQQFIPIYDSQKKIIGYRKRTIHSKRSSQLIDCQKRSTTGIMSNLSTNTSSSVINITNSGDTYSDNSSTERVMKFNISTKNEPSAMDVGEEEIIVPDIAPTSEKCIKNEDDIVKEVTAD